MGWQEDLANLVGEVTGTGVATLGAEDWASQAAALGGPLTNLSDTIASVSQPPPYLTVPMVRTVKTIQQRRPLQDALGADLGGSDELPKVSIQDITDLLGRVVKR